MSEISHTRAHRPHPNYVRVWAVLVLLLGVSVAGPLLGVPLVTLVAAFGIALVKAYLVARNFMHLNLEKPVVHWALGLVLLLLVVLYSGIAPDVQKSAGQQWQKSQDFHYVSPAARGTESEQGHDGQYVRGR